MSAPEEEREPDAVEPEATPLLQPADGVPDLTVTGDEIASAAKLLASGTGPFAVDAERASGFRYSSR
ncbi:MAG TPA: ribonuclease D, partial [Mycobacterium sp.]|nr:ribonuclease D [Mycobacterium sp.]